ncbi:hypothetical protein HPB47_005781, partial [Ixodes persulcatus]
VDPLDNEAGPSGLQQPVPAPEENYEAEEARNRKVRSVWTNSNFEPLDTTFHENHMILEEVAEPWEYFRRYFPDSLFEEFAWCTNIYGLQTLGTNLGTTPEEMKAFFGMMMIMGTLKFPRIRMYWMLATQIHSVSEAMGVNRFFKLRSDGRANDFELYQGKGTGTSLEHKHLGLGGSIVMRLVEHLQKFRNFKCFFDNYSKVLGRL